MKVFIDSKKWAIVKEDRESPFLMGENFASKLTVYVNDSDSYPTISILKANGRKRGPFNYDTSGYGTETIDGVDWHYFIFTLSTINGMIDVPGQLLITCVLNSNGSQRAFNFSNNIVKTAIDNDNGVVVYGDDPMDVINDIGKNLNNYVGSIDALNKNTVNLENTKADKEEVNDDKVVFDNSDDNSSVMIVVSIIAAVVVIVGIILLLIFLKKRRNKEIAVNS